MKKILLKLMVLVVPVGVVLIIALVVSGCELSIGNSGENNTSTVDWANYQTAGSYAIRIRNESNRDLVAFKNTLSADNLMGGVPKNANDHGIKLNTMLFNQNTDFSIIFLTGEDYEANKDNLTLLEQRPFTRIFAAYNASGTNEVPWIVSGKLGGSNRFVIQNMTGWNMELRQDSPRGTTLGYAPLESLNTTLFMNDGSFYVFPVFKKYNAVRDEIITIYPRALDGIPTGMGLSFTGGNELTINAQNYMGNANFSSGTALLVIRNDSNDGITVMNGFTEQKTATGISIINAGDERTFPVLMPAEGTGYASSTIFGGWKVVNMGVRELPIEAIDVMEADYRYTITVTGNWGDSSRAVSSPVKSAGKIISEF
ncbi:MAG: hypothetical protein LBL28_08015 [Treponema sp.]|nr:hypothetical protein [Treponema sp.]